VSNHTSAPADPCEAALRQVDRDKEAFADQEREADRVAQEQAARRAHAAELLTLLDLIGPANTAWDAAKDGLKAVVSTSWAELAPCVPTLDAALGADKDCMRRAYDAYGERVSELRADLEEKQDAAAAAAAVADAAAATLADAQDLLSQRYAKFADYMGQRRDDLQAAGQAFKAAMGTHPCDAKNAYILLREAQDIFEDFKDQAARCLPEEMRDLIIRINDLQFRAREAQTAKLHADDEAKRASAAVDAATSDKATVILALFHECKSARSGRSRAESSTELGELDISAIRARGRSAVVHSRPSRTAVCVLRVENRGPGEILITVTTTLDIAASPRGQAQRVATYEEALSMVASFLREYAAREDLGPNVS
jgi:hypothetical protein